ncbi:hypothetical protein GLYMA_07G103150v4 [Glycine max]|nr:hypothetical protein GLYMA_07G103150v4 [Glycine max]
MALNCFGGLVEFLGFCSMSWLPLLLSCSITSSLSPQTFRDRCRKNGQASIHDVRARVQAHDLLVSHVKYSTD